MSVVSTAYTKPTAMKLGKRVAQLFFATCYSINGSFLVNKIKNIAIAAALMSASFAASAQELLNQNWYIGGQAGWIRPDSAWAADKDKGAYGLKLGKALNDKWDLQFNGTYGSSKDNGSRYTQKLLGADGLYMFNRNTVRPFLLVGGGMEKDKNNVAGSFAEPTRWSPFLNVGIGVQANMTERLFFQADLRDVHGFIRGDQFNNSKSNNKYLMFSLNYLLGAAPKPAPAPAPVVAAEPAPAPAPAPVAPPPPPAPKFEKVTMSANELFSFDSATLAPEQPKLDDMAKLLNDDTSVNNVVITGHTDRLGSDKYNQKLSERRAEAVKAYLVSKGVDASRLTAQGKGKSQPVVQCNDKKMKRADLIKCLEPNRRVEIDQVTAERRVK
jgi:OOP family OmpA-OmpF porin